MPLHLKVPPKSLPLLTAVTPPAKTLTTMRKTDTHRSKIRTPPTRPSSPPAYPFALQQYPPRPPPAPHDLPLRTDDIPTTSSLLPPEKLYLTKDLERQTHNSYPLPNNEIPTSPPRKNTHMHVCDELPVPFITSSDVKMPSIYKGYLKIHKKHETPREPYVPRPLPYRTTKKAALAQQLVQPP